MTDFLTRLAERTKGRSALVQPLVLPWATPTPMDQTGVGPEPMPVSKAATPPETPAPRPLETLLAESARRLADDVSVGQSVLEDSQTTTPESTGDQRVASDLQRRHDEPPPWDEHQPPRPLVNEHREPESASPSTQTLDDQTLPTGHATPLSDTSRLSLQDAGGDQAPIDRAASIVEPTATIGADAPRDPIVPVSSEHPDGRERPPTIAAASPAVPLLQPVVEREQAPAVDSRLAIDIVSATPAPESKVTRAASITRPTLPDAAPNEPAAMPSRSPVESPADVPLVSAVNRASLADRDVGAEPEPIVAPQHASSHPLAVPAIEREPPYLTERNAAAPTVKVTIGRVEVRAAPPTPTTPTREPPRPRQPALSLDDYLKRRNGGSR